jgi:tripartite-type tricarboxylate transporter receptor subunit TctC
MISMIGSSARLGLFAPAVVVLAVWAASQASAQEPFYKGKRLNLIINFDAGSATDIDGRIFARHFVKHIEGQPNLVIQNIAGAGGVNGTLYLGEVAPKDGTAVGYLTAIAWNYASQPEKFRTDFKNYRFVGYTGGTAVYYMRKDVPPGVNRAEDLVKVPKLISGGVAAHTGRDISIRLTLDILGVPHQHVTGYRSGERARLALQRNEIQLYADTTPGYRGAVVPTFVKQGVVIPLYFDPHWNGKSFGVSKQVEGLDLMPFQEYYRKVRGKMPSGHLWETYLALITLNGAMQRIIALPPGAPPAAVNALQAALQKLNNDKEFAADAMKTLGFVPEYSADAQTGDEIRNALTVKPEIRKFVPEYIKKGSATAK